MLAYKNTTALRATGVRRSACAGGAAPSGADAQVKQLDASELRRAMLLPTHAYVLAASTAIYVWHGRASTVDARQAADAWARRVTVRCQSHSGIAAWCQID